LAAVSGQEGWGACRFAKISTLTPFTPGLMLNALKALWMRHHGKAKLIPGLTPNRNHAGFYDPHISCCQRTPVKTPHQRQL